MLEWGVLKLKWDIARKVNALLYTQSRYFYEESKQKIEKSNCHLTANYLAGIDNELWNIEKEGVSDVHNIFDGEGNISHWLEEYKSLDDALKEHEFPILCRILWWNEGSHSLIILWRTGNGRCIWFEQRWYWDDMTFCDVQQEIHAYTDGWLQIRWRKMFCKSISLPSQK